MIRRKEEERDLLLLFHFFTALLIRLFLFTPLFLESISPPLLFSLTHSPPSLNLSRRLFAPSSPLLYLGPFLLTLHGIRQS